MEPAVNAVRRFQSVALVVSGGAVAYYYFAPHADHAGPAEEDTSVAPASASATRKAHTLTGEVVDKDKQGALARALDTDCEYCLDTRRKLFNMFQGGKEQDKTQTRQGPSQSQEDLKPSAA